MSRKNAKPSQEKKPGRPEGSITQPPATIKVVRETCRNPQCRSSDLKRERVLKRMEHAQDHADGSKTTRRSWVRAMCNKCGTWQTIIEDDNP